MKYIVVQLLAEDVFGPEVGQSEIDVETNVVACETVEEVAAAIGAKGLYDWSVWELSPLRFVPPVRRAVFV